MPVISPARRARWNHGRWSAIAIALTCAVLGTGCASAVAIVARPLSEPASCLGEPPAQDTLVGVALSGGGTRAALFGTAGLEALARLPAPGGGSVLERVTYLSSVSGGSVAAGLYGSTNPGRATPVLTPAGTLSPEWETFFTRSKETVTQDIESALIWRQLSHFRWINSALAARSLSEVLAERVLGPVKMADMADREARGDSPFLIINTTLYNNGRRLAITTLPAHAMDYNFFTDLEQAMARRGMSGEIPPILRQRWQTLIPITPTEIRVDPCSLPLAGAVTGSASFPPLVGPITFKVGEEEQYWHMGDGGLYENQGIESVLFAFLKKLQEGKARRAIIIAFDSSYPFSVGYRQLSRRSEPFSLFNYDFSRIPSIMEERATAYQSLFFRSLQIEGVFPQPDVIRVIFIRHTDAKWADDLSDMPEACRREPNTPTTPQEVVERIAQVPTRFWLASECDRDLLTTAAAKVVAQNQKEIMEFLAASNR